MTIPEFEEMTECLNPTPKPVRPIPDELYKNVMQNEYLEVDKDV